MTELSIFVDESGDWGEYNFHSPYYIVGLVLHDQSKPITQQVNLLQEKLYALNLPDLCFHAGPIIRGEEVFRNMNIHDRQKIMKSLISFVRESEIMIKALYIEKRHSSDVVEYSGKLSRQLSRFIRDNLEYLLSFDVVKVYYDNGQIELNKVLSSVFNSLLDNVEFKKVNPNQYRLFQVADLICTLKLAELKLIRHQLSKSELYFFENEKTIKKNYLKLIEKKTI